MQLVGFTNDRALTRPETASTRRLAAWGAAVGLVLVAVHVVASLAMTDGVFTYILDDPYIHLALSEQIANGHYGLSPGAPAAPSSSILWPALFAPFAGTVVFGWLPLALNAACVAAATAMFAVFLATTVGLRRGWAVAAAVAAVELLYVGALAQAGMEHSLQIFLALAATVGVLNVTLTRSVPLWLPVVLAVSPLVRFEGLAIALFGAAVLAVRGHRRTAALTAVFAIAGVAAFSLFLVSLGLDPLPSSVLAKSAAGSEKGLVDMVQQIIGRTSITVPWKPGLWLLFTALCAVAARKSLARPAYLFGCATLLANMMLATALERRYDVHLLMIAVPLLAYAWAQMGSERVWRGFAAVAACVAAFQYATMTVAAPAAAQELYLQHHQTSRFVAEFLEEPVAVNDLGLISLRSPRPVLDLWGLGSADARRARLAGEPGWVGRLVAAHDVEVALVYEHWFPGEIPASWQRVGRLRLDDPVLAAAGARDVAIFAITPDAEARLRAALDQFAPTLPAGATLVLDATPVS